MEQENINDVLGIGSSQNQSNNKSEISKFRYPALITIAGFYMVLAWIVGIITIGISLYFLSKVDNKLLALISFILGLIIVLGLAAISESIKVFLDIESNTRKMAERI
jgi:hypothetical protein